jgi:hypothetical protein
MFIGSSYNLELLFADPYTDGFWNWLADNEPSDFANWDSLTGVQKAAQAAAYTTATSLTSVRTVKIDISRDDGDDGYSESIATGVSASTNPSVNTVYTWDPVTGPVTTEAKFRITDETDSTNVQYTGLLIIESGATTSTTWFLLQMRNQMYNSPNI